MGRFAWYTGVSTALAAGVIASAFNQRVNFYSACVYLAQSNLCLMILINLILLIYASFMYGLQRLCYGELRPIEVEQLYEKGWFAVTETCLAMTIFREEVGAWFLIMFVALLTGKVWGWIGDGRVEVLEQQPPANPRLFHIRLSVSLATSILYDTWMMSYIINTVIQQARPNMMVMFLFEFAILTTSSMSTGCRYAISLIEARVVGKQTQNRLVERRREVREQRAEMIRQRDAAAAEGTPAPDMVEPLPNEEDVDEMDIEVPGWEAKGQWVLTLALCTDFVKLGIYCSFFVILLMFYGLPIHIMRDLFMTTRSFTSRLVAFMRYRTATHNMNKRYPDATVEDIAREDTCIICREDMRPWSVTNPEAQPVAAGQLPPASSNSTISERTRPKKLPCGHVLHLGCLKSWLERQQVCPTCREPVVEGANSTRRGGRNNDNAPVAVNQAPGAGGQQNGAGGPPGQAPAGGRGGGMRMLNFGPLRVGFGQANLQELQQGIAAQPGQNGIPPGARIYGLELGFPRINHAQPQQAQSGAPGATIQDQIQNIGQQIATEAASLQLTQQQLAIVQALQAELERLRQVQNGVLGQNQPGTQNHQYVHPIASPNLLRPMPASAQAQFSMPQLQRHGAHRNTAAIPSGSADLPQGLTLPEGWSLLPLQRLDGQVAGAVTRSQQPAGTPAAGPAPNTTNLTAQSHHATHLQASHNPDTNISTNTTHASQIPDVVHADSPGEVTTRSPRSEIRPQEPAISAASGALPAVLSTEVPNWGNTQLFPSRSNSGDGPGTHALHASNTQAPVRDRDPGAATFYADEGAGQSSLSWDADAESDATETRRVDKGKGKAKPATVEDEVDETEAGADT
ncbi:hypothetical protein BJ878DRAFT_493592 [Calycina marina]|uniref:RING-type E3 ubiquitin transferase n=1 Tax=Calycina marina TaxID=1763456 RepID=A0A9P7Z8H7_9HELO|nr:hypothetical protein BJ878DRAFT_493592 [Calycina marina]